MFGQSPALSSARHGFFCPQLEAWATLSRSSLSCWVITPSSSIWLAARPVHFTYAPWFFHGLSQGQVWSMLQPSASTGAPAAVPRPASASSATPSPTASGSNTHTSPTPPPSPDAGKRELIGRGRALFKSRDCVDCHTPPTFTSDSTFHVGLVDERNRRLFNPPSLRGVSQRDRLFHDGRAESLEDVLLRFRHQLDAPLSKKEAAALLEYLRSL